MTRNTTEQALIKALINKGISIPELLASFKYLSEQHMEVVELLPLGPEEFEKCKLQLQKICNLLSHLVSKYDVAAPSNVMETRSISEANEELFLKNVERFLELDFDIIQGLID